jgi:hypothetical protein
MIMNKTIGTMMTQISARAVCFDASRRGKNEYDLLILDNTPIVRSRKTGKTFMFNWGFFINEAIKEGIDNEA